MAKSDRLHGRKTLKVNNFLDEFEKDDVKKQVDIIDLFNHFGIQLTKKGKNYMGLCPWHDDSNPSLSVDRDKGLYNCFGCGESGDIFTLTEKMKGYDFTESLNYLKGLAGMVRQAVRQGSPQAHQPKKTINDNDDTAVDDVILKGAASSGTPKTDVEAQDRRPDDAEHDNSLAGSITLTTVADYYHKKLYENEKAIDYLKKRGFDMPELYERFNIGFVPAPSGVEGDGSILSKISDKQKDALVDIGILNKSRASSPGEAREGGDVYEHFKNCITFPIFDDSGQVVGICGRDINDSSKFKHRYLKGQHKGVFNRKASKVYDEIILTESIIDALSLISMGFENTQSIYGTNGFTDEHLQTLKDDRIKTVIIAFDNDDPGKSASEKIKERLIAEGFKVKVIFPPLKTQNGKETFYKDWNECLIDTIDSSIIKDAIAAAELHEPIDNSNFKASKDQLGHVFQINEITYRVTGVKDMFISNLRVNIKADIADLNLRYYDNLDLYSARSRNTFSQNLSREFDVEPKRIEKDLIQILEYLEKERDRQLMSGVNTNTETELSPDEIKLGMDFLKSKNMFSEIVDDMNVLGYVGEDLNKQLLYLAATSRKLDAPISVMIVSESASGKSFLIDTVAKLLPPEDVIQATSLSEQALNYMEDMTHKFLSLGEIVHSETIEHQIREMLSAKELSRMVTTKEAQTGKLVTKIVKSPAVVSLAMSGTRYDMNPENTSRCFMVNADESREQTRRIHEAQRSKYSLGRYHAKENVVPEIIRKHHSAQKLLKNIRIVNPFYEHLDFPDALMRTRRDNERFIDLIACVCFIRQFQKNGKQNDDFAYIECDLDDYEIAYNIMIDGVLSSSLMELPRGSIELYEELRKLAKKLATKNDIEPQEVTFTQRDIRESTGFGQTWLKTHLKKLVDYEYVIVARGGQARSKGYYRLRADESIESLDLSMIPTVNEMKRLLK